MPRLLVVHHTPSSALQQMFEAAVSGARTDKVVVIRPALTAAAVDVLEAHGYLLGTPAKLASGTLGCTAGRWCSQRFRLSWTSKVMFPSAAKHGPVLHTSPASPICAEDPAYVETCGNWGCPELPRKPDLPQ